MGSTCPENSRTAAISTPTTVETTSHRRLVSSMAVPRAAHSGSSGSLGGNQSPMPRA